MIPGKLFESLKGFALPSEGDISDWMRQQRIGYESDPRLLDVNSRVQRLHIWLMFLMYCFFDY